MHLYPRAPELYSPTGKVLPKGGGVGDIGFAFMEVQVLLTSNTIGFVQISTLGNTQDFGNLLRRADSTWWWF